MSQITFPIKMIIKLLIGTYFKFCYILYSTIDDRSNVVNLLNFSEPPFPLPV